MQLTLVAGARPNFMKVAPIAEAAVKAGLAPRLVHTGQHYDERMSAQIFRDLDMREPDQHLGVGSGSHAQQTARVMSAFDLELDAFPPDVVIVVGDVNSTLACALVAAKRGIAVAHVEAGLRSGDWTMPEEINRVLTDRLSDFLFTTERTAEDNLRAEGLSAERIVFVGNVMIDSLFKHRARARERSMPERIGVRRRQYALCTIHRPCNVDTLEGASNTVSALESIAERMPAIFPIHPRTRAKLIEFKLLPRLMWHSNLHLVDPMGYIDFLGLMDAAGVVFTDSGGIQEETTALGVPCLTFRDNTERPITVTAGTNQLIGTDARVVGDAIDRVLANHAAGGAPRAPELWDGCSAPRIVGTLLDRIVAHGATEVVV